jgi:hypothetical protein
LAPIETLSPTNAARPQASPPATVTRPKEGKYVYDFSGQVLDPADPSATPRRTSGARRTHEIDHNGAVTKQTETSTASPATTIVRTRWESARVAQLSVRTEIDDTSSGCIFDPPLDVLHIPIRAEKFPRQQIKGGGSSCGGTYDLTVNGPEKVEDATGRSWDTWKITIETHTTSGNSDATEIRWISPELGKEIRIEGSFEQDAPGGARTRGESVNILRSRPGT